MLNLNRKLSRIRNRDGISIIEVLTSMAVATIGVFGVMVMIPFAIRQSQLGLDNDAANAVGRNAIEDMQIQQYFTADRSGRLQRIRGFNNAPAIMHFDPIGMSLAVPLADEDVAGISIDRVTGLNLQGNMLSQREAFQLCRSADDIQHADPDADGTDRLAPPQPLFDVDGGGARIKRQSNGRISWSMFLVPENRAGTVRDNTPTHRFRTHTLVYEGRFPETYAGGENDDTYPVDEVASINAGSQPVSQIVLDPAQNPADSIGRDNWVMLINNVNPNAPTAYDAQVMFARVTRVDGDTVTVDGGPFNFGTVAMPTETEMVFLRDVVNVFERSVAIED